MGPSWAVLAASWGPLGSSRGALGPSRAPGGGRIGRLFVLSWGCLRNQIFGLLAPPRTEALTRRDEGGRGGRRMGEGRMGEGGGTGGRRSGGAGCLFFQTMLLNLVPNATRGSERRGGRKGRRELRRTLGHRQPTPLSLGPQVTMGVQPALVGGTAQRQKRTKWKGRRGSGGGGSNSSVQQPYWLTGGCRERSADGKLQEMPEALPDDDIYDTSLRSQNAKQLRENGWL